MIGIYRIYNIQNDCCYIGSSIDMVSRVNSHMYELKRGVHTNSNFQKDFNKYGSHNFHFEYLYECEPEELIDLENKFIKKFNKTYNVRTGKIGRYKRKKPKVAYSIKVDPKHLEILKEIASVQNRSLNNAIEVAIIEYYTKHLKS